MRGYLTAFTAMILAVLMPLWLLLIRGSQISGMKARAEMAMDTGMNSTLAEYHRQMLSYYDLFFLDTSYCTDTASSEKTAEHLKSFVEHNLEPVDDLISLLGQSFFGREEKHMSASNVSVGKIRYATDGRGSVLRSQILSYEWDLLGLSGLRESSGEKALKQWEESGAADLLDNQYAGTWSAAQQQLEPYHYGPQPEEEGKERPIALQNPADYLFQLSGKALIGLILGDTSKISAEEIDQTVLYTGRFSNTEKPLQKGNMLIPLWDPSLTDRLFLMEYFLHHFTAYQMDSELLSKHETRLNCQLEYLLCGNASDLANLEETVGKLLLIRQAINTAYLFTDGEKQQKLQTFATALATAASAVTLTPVPAEPIRISLTIAWGLMESIQDLKILCKGGKIALLKGNGTWRTDLGGIADPGGNLREDPGDEKGLTYRQYLCLLLLMQNEEQQMANCMDLMEMDIRMVKGNSAFRLDACADRIVADVTIGDNDTAFTLNRECGYEE